MVPGTFSCHNGAASLNGTASARESFSAEQAADQCSWRGGGGRPAHAQRTCRGWLRLLQELVLRGTLDPQSRFRATWDMTLLLAVTYITIVLPLQV